MAKPLEVEVHEQKTVWTRLADNFIAGILLLFVVCFAYFKWSKKPFHFENPALNILAHLLLVLLPAVCAAAIFCRPLQFKPSDEQRLGVANYFSTLKYDWWTSLLLWMPLAYLLTALTMDAPRFVDGLAARQTSLGSALFTVVLSLATAGFFFSMVTDRPDIRVSDEGFRLSLMAFYEWTKIDRVVLLEDTFEIYYQASPRVPVVHVRLLDPGARARFADLLQRHGVPTSQDRGRLALMRFVVLVTAVILLVGAVVLHSATTWDMRWTYSGMVAISMGATLFFERFRGIPKVTSMKAKVDYSQLNAD